MFLQILGAFLAITCLSVIFQIPKKYILFTASVASIGWFVYLMIVEQTDSLYLANFIAAFVISVLAQILARKLKSPVTVFQIPGIMPLVPGALMYRIVYYFIQGDTIQANFYGWQTLQIAGVISIAIFIVDALFRLRKIKKNKLL